MVGSQPNKRLIDDLMLDSDSEPSTYLAELTDKFMKTCQVQSPLFKIISYYERKKSATVEQNPNMKWNKTGPLTLLVTPESACRIGSDYNHHQEIPLATNHRDLVRFDHVNDDKYQRVLARLEEQVDEALMVVPKRFRAEEALTSAEKRFWTNLNQPSYSAFRASGLLATADGGTLQWLIEQSVHSKLDLPHSNKSTLRRQDFVSWRDSDKSDCLLVTAPPGRGKPVLSNFVLGHLENYVLKKTQFSKIVYYFCNFKNESSQNASTILRTLIIQLCENQSFLFRKLPTDFQKDSQKFQSQPFATLWEIFQKMLQSDIYERVYCLIDGLDVYQTDMEYLIANLARLFNNRDKSRRPILKLFCTSRPDTTVLSNWGNLPTKQLRCDVNDIDTFIQLRTQTLSAKFTDPMKNFIFETLGDEAEGTFLWLDVVIKRIKKIPFPNISNITSTVRQSSLELDKLYEDLLKDAIQQNELARVLAWVMYARHPLSLELLGEAIAMDPQKDYTKDTYPRNDDITNLTPEFLQEQLGTVLDIVDGRVYPIHQSLKDYFSRCNPLQNSFGGITPRLVPSYISMLSFALDDDPKDIVDQYISNVFHIKECRCVTLYQYAMFHWHSNIEKAEDVQNNIPLLEQIFLQIGSPKMNLWIKTNTRSLNGQDGTPHTISRIAIIFDIGWLAELLLTGRLNKFNDNFSTMDFLEAERQVFAVLLKFQENCRLDFPKDIIRHTALNPDPTMMQLLLDQRGDNIHITEDIVKVAAGNLEGGYKVMQLLLDRRGDDFRITEDIIKVAAGNLEGGYEVMQLLLDRRGDDFRITEDIVKGAAGNWLVGYKVMQLLLGRRGDDFRITEDIVKVAAGNLEGGYKVMQLLLDRRGDDFRITEDIVKGAAGNRAGGYKVMQLLLDRRGDDIRITEDIVKAAATSGNEKTLFLLKQVSNVDIHNSGLLSTCQLFCSVYDRNYESALELLTHGIDPDVRDIYNRSPLWHAVNFEHISIIRLLLDRDIDLNVRCSRTGLTPLLLAAINMKYTDDELEILKILIEAGADCSIADNDGRTALSVARDNTSVSREVREMMEDLEEKRLRGADGGEQREVEGQQEDKMENFEGTE